MSKITYNSMQQVLNRKAIARSTLYAEIKHGVFPKPIKLGKRKIVWPEHEIDQMMLLYLSEPSAYQLREFVRELENNRCLNEVYNGV